MNSNRMTLLTAPGAAAIAVVRLSGPAIDLFLDRHFSKPVPMDRCVHGLLRDGDRVIDDAIAVRHGNILDLNLHGGTWVVHSVLDLAKLHGFEISDIDSADGETEIWKSVLQTLPKAKTEQAVRMLLAQPRAWESPGDLRAILNDHSGKWMLATPRVAIVGPPNVGKSTLANQLFGQERSITADLPGTTRDWVGEIANIDGLAIMLVDTPGIRTTVDPIEDAAIAASKPQIQSADLIVLVLDQSQPLDHAIVNSFPDSIRVANKSDGSLQWDAAEIGAIQTIATIGTGMDELRKQIRRRFGCDPMDPLRVRWWTESQRLDLQKQV
jgi:small GTP-binding protein